jgi:hypothetical protein
MTKVKAGKKFFDSLGELGPKIQSIAAEFRLDKSWIHYEVATAGLKAATLYNNEGQRSWVFYGEKWIKVETVSANTLGAAGVTMDVCGSMPMPAGSTFVTIEYFGGRYVMRVVNVAAQALQGVA